MHCFYFCFKKPIIFKRNLNNKEKFNLHELPFPMLFLPLYESGFPSGIILLLYKRFSLTFFVMHV